MVAHGMALAVPAARNVTSAAQRGAALFDAARLRLLPRRQADHRRRRRLSGAANQAIRPYTDLLLHDMGPGLADGRPDYLAGGSEWRTPPLWGLGLCRRSTATRCLLHDGRARGFAEAILWHGGQADAAKEAFRTMLKSDRDALIAFLQSR